MDFELSDDQQALAGLIRAIVAGRFPLERTRRAEDARIVVDGDDWAALGEAGVFSLTVPEADGGAGLGLADAAVVFEELGRGLVPGPLVASHLAGDLTGDLRRSSGPSALSGSADGTLVVGSVRLPGPAEPAGAGPLLVEHLGALGALVVEGPGEHLSVVAGDQLAGLVAAARAVERPLDPLTPLDVVADLPPGVPVEGGEPVARRWLERRRVLVGALCVGIASATCDLAVDYARGRQQFGRPIGSFQAVKHLCADMLVRAETARAAVHAAAVTADQPEVGDAGRLAAGSALLATEAALTNAKAAIQVHGGMGFTWEVPLHLYLMRARVLAASLGPAGDLAHLVAERL